MMPGNTFNLILCFCLAVGAAGSTLQRIKRQWDFPFSDSDSNPYGNCGKPTIPIPNGGIRLFPDSDFDDIHDHSCDTGGFFCTPKFYCNDGYDVKGNIDLECVLDEVTGEYHWKGDIPTCVKYTSSTHVYFYAVPVVFVVSIICVVIRYSIRRSARSQPRCVSRTTTITIPRSTTISTGRSVLPGGPPPYARFDDSNIQVPKGETTTQPQA